MLKVKILLFSFVLTFIGFLPSKAQILRESGAVNFSLLEHVVHLPKYLLTNKSVILVQVPDQAGNPAKRGNWKDFAATAHEGIKKVGIDAVAYYHIDDVFSGVEAQKSFTALFTKRKIKYLILLSQSKNSGPTKFSLTITGFNSDKGLDIEGQKAWKAEDGELSKLLNDLYLLANQSKLENSNLLINDVPEFFGAAKVIKGQRYEAYQPNLKTDKLAVVKFKPIEMPQGVDAQQQETIQKYNQKVSVANDRLAEIVQQYYPYSYDLVEPNIPHKALKDKGFQFVLKTVSTVGKNIKKILAYDYDENETHYISIIWNNAESSFKKFPKNTHVFKYYMQDTVTGNTYLGTKWDTDVTWEKALMNHLNNLKRELKIN